MPNCTSLGGLHRRGGRRPRRNGQLDKLDEQEGKLQQEGEAEGVADERLEEIGEALDALAEKREAIEEARLVDDPDARAKAGAFVVLDHDGKVRIERGLVQRSQKAPRHETAEAASESKKKAKPEFSDALTRRLTAERTLALRAVLAAQPEHALTALVHALVLKEFYNDRHPVICITVRDEAICSVRASTPTRPRPRRRCTHCVGNCRKPCLRMLPTCGAGSSRRIRRRSCVISPTASRRA
jgi:hypothetical protein